VAGARQHRAPAGGGLGGWLALRWGGGLSGVFAAQGVALVVYGMVSASAIAGGAWFGRVGWPRTHRRTAAPGGAGLKPFFFEGNSFNERHPMKIKDSVVFITGANRGSAWRSPRPRWPPAPARSMAPARDPEEHHAGRRDAGGARRDATRRRSKRRVRACGDVTLLVNNAGISRGSSFLGAPDAMAAARAEFETNFFGPWAVTQAFAPVLAANGGGAVLNALSVLSWATFPSVATYCASKSAAWSLSNGLRNELAGQGTQVTSLHMA
jgi:hypothetical protein